MIGNLDDQTADLIAYTIHKMFAIAFAFLNVFIHCPVNFVEAQQDKMDSEAQIDKTKKNRNK